MVSFSVPNQLTYASSPSLNLYSPCHKYKTTQSFAKLLKNVSLIALSSLLASACNSSESTQTTSSPSGKTVATSSLLKRVPLESYGVFVGNSGSDIMQKYRQTPWGRPSTRTLDQLKSSESEEAQKAVAVIEALEKSALASTLGLAGGESSIDEVVAYVANRPETMSFGAIAHSNNEKDLNALLDQVISVMKEKGLTVTEVSSGDPKIFSLPINLEEDDIKIKDLFFAASKDTVAISTHQDAFERIFDASAPSDLPPLFNKASFKNTLAKGKSNSVLSFAFVDMKDLLNHFMRLSKANKNSEEGDSSAEKLEELIKTVPLDYLSYFRSMKNTLMDEVTLQLTPQTEEQKKTIESLAGIQPQNLLTSAPSSFVFLLGLDINYFVKVAEQQMPKPDANDQEAVATAQNVSMVLNYLKPVQSLNLGLRQSKGSSPFPDLTIFLASDQAEILYMQLKTLVMMGMKASPLKNLQWLQKQVEGLDVDYALSPFGIGLFMAKTSNHIIFSSSEAGLTSVARSFKGDEDKLWTQLPAHVKESIGDGAGFISYAANLSEFSELLQSFQSSLSMFTGGQSPIKDEDILRLKSLGTVVGTTTFSDNALKLKAVYEVNKGS
jgi:hypothetical protein